ncbi:MULTISPECIES: dTDP-4-dehydrorhamnose 3,5-epimerase [Parachlamydia]|jgi:dTDP-4-dehydrorhamnose 3,5-epimerase|uniref:dTDP-4-dehydrorhamnose 3,5-epimerase n=2 Tax=Parachlamydia acanthamoebae TaxID=83552 RepID=F8KWL1_PARAV|nr:dTDP-4-dehydrorhamnose 3,5-epimerase [Parachlamydia acanthamoebae]KIA76123.1 dTDP-4-dehydrorhamnose 3,5-epimerase [Parachlamydia acanthamoebae]CCB85416.1 dTDP-4-dehydrorhamnose 3,5-epimerase [Parachlamydia acanthamoebae UV-7]
MHAIKTEIPDVILFEHSVFRDARGFFLESYRASDFAQEIGAHKAFVQDNHSHSLQGVLRGLHYQYKKPQGKLVRVVTGEIFDVAVDLRQSSPTYGKWVGRHLSAERPCSMWIPPEFAHGFLVLSSHADVLYKTTDYYDPSSEFCLRWNDPQLAINWPLQQPPMLSKKDTDGKLFKELPHFL